WPQPARHTARARRAADRRTVSVQSPSRWGHAEGRLTDRIETLRASHPPPEGARENRRSVWAQAFRRRFFRSRIESMAFDALRDTLPDYAKDIKLTLGSLANDQTLTDQQKWGAFLACAQATGVPSLIRALEAETSDKLTPEAKTAAKAAA